MPERDDPFADLDAKGRSRAEQIGDRLAERDRTDPEPDTPKPPETPRPSNRYAWLVGILLFAGIVALLFIQALPNQGAAVQGLQPGTPLPSFAVPLARSALEGDANVCQRRPCPSQSGPVPACELTSDQVLNACRLRRRPTVITFIVDRGGDCKPQVDRVERVRGRVPGVEFAVVFFTREDRDETRAIVRRRRWQQPVGIDRDGAVANLFGIGVCPTTVFSRAGGRVDETTLGNLTEDDLEARARRLLRR